MGFYNIIIKYRFWLSLVAIFGGLALELTGVAGFWPVFPLYFIGLGFMLWIAVRLALLAIPPLKRHYH